uniref:Uncharacterized protein n=1 Tax=Eutreptiella gymnastica TaxID=73025 RepID=A0A7S4FTJ7_9EUGL
MHCTTYGPKPTIIPPLCQGRSHCILTWSGNLYLSSVLSVAQNTISESLNNTEPTDHSPNLGTLLTAINGYTVAAQRGHQREEGGSVKTDSKTAPRGWGPPPEARA